MCSLIVLEFKLHTLQAKQALSVNLVTVLVIQLFLIGKKCFDLKTLDLWTDVWDVTHLQEGDLQCITVLFIYRDCTTWYNVTIKVSSWTLQASQMRPLCCRDTLEIKGQDMYRHIAEELIPQLWKLFSIWNSQYQRLT